MSSNAKSSVNNKILVMLCIQACIYFKLTHFAEVFNCITGSPLIDNPPQGEEGECVKQLEDGVARLVDGHDDQSVVSQTPTVIKQSHHNNTQLSMHKRKTCSLSSLSITVYALLGRILEGPA